MPEPMKRKRGEESEGPADAVPESNDANDTCKKRGAGTGASRPHDPNGNDNANDTHAGKDENKDTNKSKNKNKNRKNKDGASKRGKADLDFDLHPRRHVALRVAYRGAAYHGLATQNDSERANTVEDELFRAIELTRLSPDARRANYSRCGRTDAGVSAYGQVVAFVLRCKLSAGVGVLAPRRERPVGGGDKASSAAAVGAGNPGDDGDGNARQTTNANENANSGSSSAQASSSASSTSAPATPMSSALAPSSTLNGGCAVGDTEAEEWARIERDEIDYVHVLNRVLPDDIRVISWSPVSSSFNARFDCLWRTYRYFFHAGGMDVGAMRSAARSYVGLHDFRNLCKPDTSAVLHFERRVLSCAIRPAASGGGVMYFEITGFAFLWRQVRCLFAILDLVGRGLEDPSVTEKLLDVESVPRAPHYAPAEPDGLVLFDCKFEGLRWVTRPVGTRRAVSAGFSATAARAAVRAAADAAMAAETEALFTGSDDPGAGAGTGSARPRKAHIPLLQRGGGATIEEKVASLSGRKKAQRQEREEHVKKGGRGAAWGK